MGNAGQAVAKDQEYSREEQSRSDRAGAARAQHAPGPEKKLEGKELALSPPGDLFLNMDKAEQLLWIRDQGRKGDCNLLRERTGHHKWTSGIASNSP